MESQILKKEIFEIFRLSMRDARENKNLFEGLALISAVRSETYKRKYYLRLGEIQTCKRLWALIKKSEALCPKEMNSPEDNDFSSIPESQLPFNKEGIKNAIH